MTSYVIDLFLFLVMSLLNFGFTRTNMENCGSKPSKEVVDHITSKNCYISKTICIVVLLHKKIHSSGELED